MNQASLRQMIEEATPQERRQFRAWTNYYLSTEYAKCRRKEIMKARQGEDNELNAD